MYTLLRGERPYIIVILFCLLLFVWLVCAISIYIYICLLIALVSVSVSGFATLANGQSQSCNQTNLPNQPLSLSTKFALLVQSQSHEHRLQTRKTAKQERSSQEKHQPPEIEIDSGNNKSTDLQPFMARQRLTA